MGAARRILPFLIYLTFVYSCNCVCTTRCDAATVCLPLDQYLLKGSSGRACRRGCKGEPGLRGRKGANGQPGLKGSPGSETVYVLMSPSWLQNNAQILELPTARDAYSMVFGSGKDHGPLFKAAVIAGEKMNGWSSVVVELKFWYERLSTDNDMSVGLCDNQKCVGVEYTDNDGGGIYPQSWNSPSVNGICYATNQKKISWKYLSATNRATITFELTSSQASAIVSSDETTSIAMFTFTRAVLNFNTGLWMMACRNDYNEQYGMRFFEARVRKNGFS